MPRSGPYDDCGAGGAGKGSKGKGDGTGNGSKGGSKGKGKGKKGDRLVLVPAPHLTDVLELSTDVLHRAESMRDEIDELLRQAIAAEFDLSQLLWGDGSGV